jgi:LCP family protein required for cell wall assembly
MNHEKFEINQRKRLRKERVKLKKAEMKQAIKDEKRSTSKVAGFGPAFITFFVIFTLLFVGGRLMIKSFADINFFAKPENAVALKTLVNEDSPFFDIYNNSNKVNVLLLGVNSGMTDTIMLVSFDMDSKKVDVISVPRDTFYHRPNLDSAAEMKINAAYRGEAINTAKAVSEVLLGMPINYYAVIEYDGVEKIVDSMGGVPMDIPFHMEYSDPYDTPPLVIDIPEGPQVLDGAQAVQFLRYRYGYIEGDMGRVKAQQEFVKNAFKQCLGFDLPKIANTVFKNVESDITLGTALKIATKAAGIAGENMTTYTIPHTLESEAPYYVYPDSIGIAAMIEEIYAVPVETTESSLQAE